MGRYERKDHYYRRAKAEGKASRAAYKIEELQAKYRLIRAGSMVVDLGCAPGGWLQALSRMVGAEGRVVGIDIAPVNIRLPANVEVIEADIENIRSEPRQLITLLGSEADLVVSDMAPHTSGITFRDCYRSFELAGMAFEVAKSTLKSGGSFVTKIFDGPEVKTLCKDLHKCFKKVGGTKPQATRHGSRELYLVAIGFKGR